MESGKNRNLVLDDDPAIAGAGPKIAAFTNVTVLTDGNKIPASQGSVWRHSASSTDQHTGPLLHMAIPIKMNQAKDMKIGTNVQQGHNRST